MSDYHSEPKMIQGMLLVRIIQTVPLSLGGGLTGIVAQLLFNPQSKNIGVNIAESCYRNTVCMQYVQDTLQQYGLAAAIGFGIAFAVSNIVLNGVNQGSYIGATELRWIDTDSDQNLN